MPASGSRGGAAAERMKPGLLFGAQRCSHTLERSSDEPCSFVCGVVVAPSRVWSIQLVSTRGEERNMPAVEVFPRAPIVEAILSLEVNPVDDLFGAVEEFRQAVGKELPVRERIGGPARALNPSGRLQSPTTAYRFASEDGLHVVQISERVFSFHRMRPYQDWDRFSATAKQFWETFAAHFRPERVSDIHLRYLNRIEIPMPLAALPNYLSLYPKVPEGIDTGSSGYLLRVSLSDPSVPALAYVTQRSEYDPVHGMVPVVFDIDVSRVCDFTVADEELWLSIERLRDYKNRLFFESITEETRALFR